MSQAVNSLELAADVKVLGDAVEVLGAGVGVVVAAKDVDGLVDPVDGKISTALGFSLKRMLHTCLGGRRRRR